MHFDTALPGRVHHRLVVALVAAIAALGPPKEQRILRFAIKFDFIGDKRECPKLSLLPWCLSVPEALKTDLISGEVRRRK